jgi:PAS domain S-box-containing protein
MNRKKTRTVASRNTRRARIVRPAAAGSAEDAPAEETTERKRAEEAPRGSREQYRFLFDNMLNGLAYCRMDYEDGIPQDFVYLAVNPAFERLTRLKDVVGKKVSEVIPGIRRTNPELFEIYGRVALSGKPEQIETYVDSLGIWFSIAVYSPRREHFVAVFDNITERKRAEQRTAWLASFPELNPSPVIEADLCSGALHYANPAARRLFSDLEQHGLAHPWLEGLVEFLAAMRAAGTTVAQRKVTLGGRCFQQNVSYSFTDNRVRVYGIDITACKQAEDALRASEEQFRLLVEGVKDYAIFLLDSDGTVRSWNAGAQWITGYEAGEVVGRHFSCFYTPEDVADGKPDRDLRAAMEAGRLEDESWRVRKDGSRFWASVVTTPLRDAAGTFRGFVRVARDVTARKQAEEELRRVNRALRVLTECNKALVRTTDEADLLQRICATLVESGGYRVAWVGLAEAGGEQLVRPIAHAGYEDGYLNRVKITWGDDEHRRGPTGTAIRTGLPCVIRDTFSDPRFAPWREHAQQMGYRSALALPLAHDAHTFGSLSIYSADPAAFDEAELSLLEELAEDVAYGLGALRTRAHQDLAEQALHQSVARLRSLVDNAAYGIGHISLEGYFVAANPALVRMLGYDSETELLRIPVVNVFRDPAAARVLAQQGDKSERIEGLEVELTRKDGSYALVRLSGRVVRAADGTLEAVEIITEDVTRQRQLEDQLRQAQKMEAVGRLAGGIAHDFNNLLTAVMGYSELVLGQLEANHPLRADLEQIRRAGESAASLTRQLLAFSRKQTLQPEVLNLNEQVASVDKLLRRVIGEDVALVTVPGRDLDFVKVDPGQLEQVIVNLAVNARDAMPNGGTLTIQTANVVLDDAYARTHVGAVAGPYVMLAVGDTGCGMTPEVRAHLFEPFFTTKKRGKGTGLGLSTVYGIVKQSNGYIWVDSEVGKGTTFRIYLPPCGASKPRRVPRAPHRQVAGGETILLVEDDVPLKELAARTLRDYGYKVVQAGNAEEALDVCEQHRGPIHLLLTDVVLPGLSGPALAERLRALRPRIKVLFMSGYLHPSMSRDALLAVGGAFLQKPYTMAALAQKARGVLGSRRKKHR